MQRLAGRRLQLRRGFDDREPGPHRPLGVVLVCLGVTEISEHAVAHILGDEPAALRDQVRAALVIGPNDPAHVLGIETRGHRGRTHEIAKHHGQLSSLGGRLGCRTDRGVGSDLCGGG
jgi:hypothetical protein